MHCLQLRQIALVIIVVIYCRTVKVGSLVLIADGTVVTNVKEIKEVNQNTLNI
jgi:hypothetical protein